MVYGQGMGVEGSEGGEKLGVKTRKLEEVLEKGKLIKK